MAVYRHTILERVYINFLFFFFSNNDTQYIPLFLSESRDIELKGRLFNIDAMSCHLRVSLSLASIAGTFAPYAFETRWNNTPRDRRLLESQALTYLAVPRAARTPPFRPSC